MTVDAPSPSPSQARVTDRFGVLPNFFCTAAAAPGLIEELWNFAKSAYLDSALPSLFKERLFVQLSRFCEIRYCIVRHVGFLIGQGRPAGDAEAVPESVDDVIALLSRPVPDAVQLAAALDRLRGRDTALPLPASGTQAEADLFDALTVIFVEPAQSGRAREAVRAAVGDGMFELVTAYLAFVRTAHFWTETHPELAYEPDMLTLMEQRPDLQLCLLSPEDAEKVRAGGELKRVMSELHETGAALRASETRFRAFVTATADVVYRMGPDWSEMRQLDGRGFLADTPNPDENWMDGYILPEDHTMVREAIDQAIRTKSMFELEHRVMRADGSPGWTHSRAVPILDAAGEITEWIGAAKDVSATREAQEHLRESEERFRSFAETSTDALWILEADRQELEYLSPAFERIWGEPRAAVLADRQRWAETVHPDDRDSAGGALAHTLKGETFTAEYRIRRNSDGAVRWIRDAGFPIRNEHGRVVRVGGIARDITDEKAAARYTATLLAELQHRVRNILALTRSIARRSNDGERSAEEYAQHLDGRLAALARTQVLLTRKADAGVAIEDLLRDELLVQVANEDQVRLEGPEVELAPKAAEVLTLAVHELTTNSTKYGALSSADGRLEVRWSIDDRVNQSWLSLEWIEKGVAVLDVAPRREGFGLELITRRVPYELKGSGTFELRPGGLYSRIEFPLVRGQSILQTGGASA